MESFSGQIAPQNFRKPSVNDLYIKAGVIGLASGFAHSLVFFLVKKLISINSESAEMGDVNDIIASCKIPFCDTTGPLPYILLITFFVIVPLLCIYFFRKNIQSGNKFVLSIIIYVVMILLGIIGLFVGWFASTVLIVIIALFSIKGG